MTTEGTLAHVAVSNTQIICHFTAQCQIYGRRGVDLDRCRSSGPSCRSDVGPTETIRRLFMDETRARSSIPRKKRLSLGVGPR